MPTKFDFISPGIQLNEIDESQVPAAVSNEIGPVIVGRALAGPAMKPIRISNIDDFNEIFGKGISGKGDKDNDIWRNGNLLGPTYGVYAAQAHLASQTTPVTYVRLLGEAHPDADSNAELAGWAIDNSSSPSRNLLDNKSAYGLFIVQSASIGTANTGSLAAIFYINSGSVVLNGTLADSSATTASAGALIQSVGTSANRFNIQIFDSTGAKVEDQTVDFEPGSSNYIRDRFNTNPQLLQANKNFGLSDKNYFLGETFEEAARQFGGTSTGAGKQYGIILALHSGSLNYGDHKKDMAPSKSGWFINRKSADGTIGEKLFRCVGLHDGEWLQNNYQLAIKDLNLGNDIEVNSTFTLEIQDINGNTVEQFSGLNLDPNSENYISKRVGDQYQQWDAVNSKYNVRGLYANRSNYIYIEVANAVEMQQLSDKHALPVGFYGPLRPKGFALLEGRKDTLPFGTDHSGVNARLELIIGAIPTNGNNFAVKTNNGSKLFEITASNGVALAASSASFGTGVDNGSGDGSGVIGISDTPSTGSYATTLATLLNSIDGYNARVEETLTGSTDIRVIVESDRTIATTDNLTGAAGLDTNLMVGTQTLEVVNGANHTPFVHSFVKGNTDIAYAHNKANTFANLPHNYSASFVFPSLRLTDNNSNYNGKNYTKNDFQGVRHHRGTSTKRDDSYIDLVRVLPTDADNTLVHHLGENESPPDVLENSFIFTLDDVRADTANSLNYYYDSGSYDAGTSIVKVSGSIKDLINLKVKQFRAPLFGGHDGLDLTEVEPFSNKNLTDKTRVGSYAYNSIFKALESIEDPESVDYNVLTIPGITQTDVTDKVLEVASERQDHLAIIDVEGGHKPAYENNGSVTNGTISTTITSLEGRKINTSYAATYYPWVRMTDRLGGQGDSLYVPPSVAAVGALAKSEGLSELWFAPAGFNRGGINELGGSQGPIITGTWEHLTKDDRDDLYQNNINPIARFPSLNQIVIFGQKTLQQTPSALDRINVRRLLIFLKSEIGQIANTLLFDQNVETTWGRFKTRAGRVLQNVQGRLGISEFKLVLDESTTTADYVDRNIIYAKIFIKPVRSVEFIAVDFVISRSGVEF